MAEDEKRPGSRPPGAASDREKRLAEALRANLRRRKTAHAPDDSPGRPGRSGDTPPPENGGKR